MLNFGCCLSYFICSIRSIKPDWFASAISRYIQVRWVCCPYLRGQFREQAAWRKQSLGLNSVGRICSPLRSVQSKLFLPLDPFLTLSGDLGCEFLLLAICIYYSVAPVLYKARHAPAEITCLKLLESLQWRPNVGASSDIQAPRLMGNMHLQSESTVSSFSWIGFNTPLPIRWQTHSLSIQR